MEKLFACQIEATPAGGKETDSAVSVNNARSFRMLCECPQQPPFSSLVRVSSIPEPRRPIQGILLRCSGLCCHYCPRRGCRLALGCLSAD